MADSSMDVAAANRFISSLSKSLQALCHGCMDFDAGIEIVGYINVNIDSGSKVDYVLNEKVLKSTTNSMTFVSNSFLAKKEQPKQCRDGSCSPILELNQPLPPPFHHRSRGGHSYPPSHHYRSSGIYSPHSQVLRGSQKRAWNGPERDWRASPRKHPRDSRPPHTYPQQSSQEHFDSSASHTIPPSSHFLSSQPETESSDPQSKISIKKELDDQNVGNEDSSNQTTSKHDGAGAGALPENVNVKQDPDSVSTQEGDSKFENSTEALSQADLSSSFLQQPQTETEAESNADASDKVKSDLVPTDDSDVTFGASGDNSTGANSQEGDNYVNDPNNTGTGDGGEESIGMEADYEGSTEDMFSQPSYSGEGSSAGGQFEVIEIDDEDEDVQAMFNEAQQRRQRPNVHRVYGEFTSPCAETSFWHTGSKSTEDQSGISCEFCGIPSFSLKDHQRHMNRYHRDTMTLPFKCSSCGRGFYSRMGLKDHEIKHQGLVFNCEFCASSFDYCKGLYRHMARVHQKRKCKYCDVTYDMHSGQVHICRQEK